MGKLVTPKVYLIGHTVIREAALDEYLRDSGNSEFWSSIASARTQGLTDGEILCSLYAKLCYASLTLGKNTNVTRVRDIPDNLVGCFESGHGCYDAETEVLTFRGWVKWPDVKEQDTLISLEPETQSIKYLRPIRLIHYHHEGRMYRVESQHVDLLVTPDHKMLACKTTTREGRSKQVYSLTPATELGTRSHAYLKTGIYSGGVGHWPVSSDGLGLHGLTVDRDVATLLGFTIGDGYTENGSILSFHLRRERKIAWLQAVVQRLQWRAYESGDKQVIVVPDEHRTLFASIYGTTREKQIPDGFLLVASANTQRGLFEGLMQSDGHIGETGDCFDTTSSKLAGQFQHLCLNVGLAANICYTYDASQRPQSYGTKPLTRLSVIRRSLRPEVNRWSGADGRTFWVDDWDGEVFCADVGGHALYVRRNGIPVWSGNSVFEHCQLNFVIRNCSRVFTHELVRHRVGTAFSQTSGRYVRGDSVDLVFDPILEPVKDRVERLQKHIEQEYKFMVELMHLDEMKDFTRKKKITSALRRILPNGQSNEIGFSVNLRTLRHVVQLRTSRQAEWEIREVFGQVYRLVKAQYPLAFHSAKEELIDGAVEITGMKIQPWEKGGSGD